MNGLVEKTRSLRKRGFAEPEKRGSGSTSEERRAPPFRPPRAVARLRRVFRASKNGLLRTRFLRERVFSTQGS